MKYIPPNQLTLIQQDIFRLGKQELLPLNHEVATTDEDTNDEENLDSKDNVPKEVRSEDGDDNDDKDDDED